MMFSLLLYHYLFHGRDISDKNETQVLKMNQKEI